ncbi:hypothetical protein A2U01_0115184, partial [Trifolium medium]|nr:hypothetical protein [Trifolium medium]
MRNLELEEKRLGASISNQ